MWRKAVLGSGGLAHDQIDDKGSWCHRTGGDRRRDLQNSPTEDLGGSLSLHVYAVKSFGPESRTEILEVYPLFL